MKEKLKLKCQMCEKECLVFPSLKERFRYCSRVCSDNGARRKGEKKREEMLKKPCRGCGKSIPDIHFYKDATTCNECHVAWNAEWTKKNKNLKYTANNRYLKSLKGREAVRKHTKKFRINNPEKYKAHILVGTAIRNGTLKRQLCERCLKEKVHAHHEDYSKPLEVRWLCSNCHIQRHKEMMKEREKHNKE